MKPIKERLWVTYEIGSFCSPSNQKENFNKFSKDNLVFFQPTLIILGKRFTFIIKCWIRIEFINLFNIFYFQSICQNIVFLSYSRKTSRVSFNSLASRSPWMAIGYVLRRFLLNLESYVKTPKKYFSWDFIFLSNSLSKHNSLNEIILPNKIGSGYTICGLENELKNNLIKFLMILF